MARRVRLPTDRIGKNGLDIVLVNQPPKESRTQFELEAEARLALDRARAMPHGAERSEALKEAGRLQRAADIARGPARQAKPGTRAATRSTSV
jgi:hypothetical protein